MVASVLGGQKGRREVIKCILIVFGKLLIANLPLIRGIREWMDGLRHLFFAFQEKISL